MTEPQKKKVKIKPQEKISTDSKSDISKSIKDSSNNSNLGKNEEMESSNFDSWDSESTCWGCREGQPNQQAHMDIGGCLYCYFDSDSENDTE